MKGVTVDYTLYSDRGAVLCTGRLHVTTSMTLNFNSTTWDELVTVTLVSTTNQVTSLNVAFDAGCTSPCRMSKTTSWTDSFQKLGFSVGVGYSKKLTAGVTYDFWIHAQRARRPALPNRLAGKKSSIECNDAGMGPGNSCRGLNYTRPGSDTELMVTSSRNWHVPSRAEWVRGGSPTAQADGSPGCPANCWSPPLGR